MIGQTVSHYRVLRKIGGGGMGVVYEAEDLELDRHVALKFLPEGMADDAAALERFRREARAASALNHPHICTIFEIGEHDGQPFLILELLEGETLADRVARGRQPGDEVVRFSRQLLDALDAAHRAGIVHRDIKPANLFVNERGDLKVLDFGLAKREIVPQGDSDTSAPTMRASGGPLTTPGTTMGTVNYMSPEQVRAEELDARTDLFSAGVVIYEMATGTQPFTGPSAGVVFSEILNAVPTPINRLNPQAPPGLGDIIDRLLVKDRQSRYQAATDALSDLISSRGSSGSAPVMPEPAPPPMTGSAASPSSDPGVNPAKAESGPASDTAGAATHARWIWIAIAVVGLLAAGSAWLNLRRDDVEPPAEEVAAESDERTLIVVLPFENLGDSEDDYFAAGVVDEISNRLGSIAGLAVISRSSARRYEATDKTLRQIGEELGVSHVVEGTVRWARGDDGSSRVRITPELVRVADDTQLWSTAIERDIDDIFALQAEIAEQVANGLGLELGDKTAARLQERPTESQEAYSAYLRGQQLLHGGRQNQESRVAALKMFEDAIHLDPGFHLAWVGLATTRAISYYFSDYGPKEPDNQALATIKEAVDRAVELAPEHPRSNLARGYYLYWGLREFAAAAEEFQVAVRELPNDAEAFHALALISRRLGRWQESLEAFERSVELDPTNPYAMSEFAFTHWALRDYDTAQDLLDLAVDINPDEPYWGLRIDLAMHVTGSPATARRVLDERPDVEPEHYLEIHVVERNWAEILSIYQEGGPREGFAEAVRQHWIGFAQRELGNRSASIEAFEVVRDMVRPHLEGATPPWFALLYGVASWGVGDPDEALRLADAVETMNPGDQYFGQRYLESKATLYGIGGDAESAMDILEGLMVTPYSFAISTHTLRLHPQWDSLRDNPRFQALIGE